MGHDSGSKAESADFLRHKLAPMIPLPQSGHTEREPPLQPVGHELPAVARVGRMSSAPCTVRVTCLPLTESAPTGPGLEAGSATRQEV